MANWLRSGSCSQCGECCGTGPNPTNPWITWPERIQRWGFSVFEDLFKYAGFVGITIAPDGTVQWENYGNVKIPAEGTFYWTWIFENGLCTDLPPYGDLVTYDVKCPFLMPNEGTPEAPYCPCAIQSRPQFSTQWGMVCGWRKDTADMTAEELARHGPGDFYNQASVDQWNADHPHCSFIWTEAI